MPYPNEAIGTKQWILTKFKKVSKMYRPRVAFGGGEEAFASPWILSARPWDLKKYIDQSWSAPLTVPNL